MEDRVRANIGQSKRLLLVLVLTVLGMSACGGSSTLGKADDAASTVAVPSHYEHTVHWPGETLSLIAKWYTGDAKNWSILARENPDVSPSKLKISATIRIPRELLTITEPMPRSFVGAQTPKSKQAQGNKGISPRSQGAKAASSGEAHAAQIPEGPAEPPGGGLDLFGPKE